MSENSIRHFDLWKLSLQNVFSMPVRTGLTVLGFAIGVAAVLAVITLGEAGKAQVESEMGRLGINKVWISAETELRQGTADLLEKIIDADAEELIHIPAQIINMEGKTADSIMIGCEWSFLKAFPTSDGITREADWNADRQAAYAGKNLAEKLDVDIGDLITANAAVFRICGILKETDSFSTVPVQDALVVPINSAKMWSGGMVQEIQLTGGKRIAVDELRSLAQRMFDMHSIDASVMTMKTQMDAAGSVIKTFVSVLRWVAVVCVLVGGIGILNILLISVRERKREIGVMKSLGTTSGQICFLFLYEALIYAVSGGAAGILLGFALIRIAGASIDLHASASVGDTAVVFLCAVCMGLFFGVAPARKASALSCVDALRQE